MKDTLQLLSDSWLSTTRSTEHMVRGNVNGRPMMKDLKEQPSIESIFECEVVGVKQHSWIACSPDRLDFIHPDKVCFQSVERAMESVEIKMRVAT